MSMDIATDFGVKICESTRICRYLLGPTAIQNCDYFCDYRGAYYVAACGA